MNPVIETRLPFRFARKPLSQMGACLLGLFIAGATSAQEQGKPPSAKEMRAALVAAGKLAKTPKGASKKEKHTAQARAVEAYARLEALYATQEPIVAQARFRRAQLLGRMGQEDQALRAYRGALTSDVAAIGARAMLEAGHLERRLKRYSEALGFYREAAELAQPASKARANPDAGASKKSKGPTPNQRYGSQARLWMGATMVKLGRVPDARSCWKALAAESSQEPSLRIKAFDRLAMSYLAEKNDAEARKVLLDADESLAAACEGKSKKAQSLQRSLARMRARKTLAKAETARQEQQSQEGAGEKKEGGRE